jgi:hypothetical protein
LVARVELPSFVYAITDVLGLGEYDVIYTLSEGTAGEGDDEDGILFGAWSAEGDSVALVFGAWSAVAVPYEPEEDTWSG